MKLTIAQVVVGLPVEGPFDYLIPESLDGQVAVGTRVLVRFAGKKRMGVVVALLATSSHEGILSTLIKVLDENPVFSLVFLKLADFFARRFACTLGEAFDTFLPAYLRSGKKFKGDAVGEMALSGPGEVELLFDQGHSKRWDLLVPRIAKALHDGKGVLVLVPDSTRCPDVLPKLGPLVQAKERVLLTRGTPKEEYARWQSVHSGQARLVVGFISAVFAPVRNLGLIVVVEEESGFYKHDQSPFYHAREVAMARAALQGCDLVCVTSAPSVEMWLRAKEGQARMTRLEDDLADVKFLDLSNFKMRKGTFISLGLRHHLEAMMKENRKVLLYIQAARGVAGVVDEVKKYFPSASVAGYDKASSALPEGFDVLVATQSVLRFRSSLKVAFTAVLDIDWEFHKHDHEASHGAFVLVQHLRQMTHEHVLLQTRQAGDLLMHTLASADVKDFFDQELALRREMGVPPFQVFVTLMVRSKDPVLACTEAKRLYDMLMPGLPEEAILLEPQQDRAPIVRDKFRFCIFLHGPDRDVLVNAVKAAFKTFRPKKDTVVTVNVA